MTAYEWFLTLPQPYQDQAIENSRIFSREISRDTLVDRRNSLQDAISYSFRWSDSQGDRYWMDVIIGRFPIIKPKNLKGFGTYCRRFINFSQNNP